MVICRTGSVITIAYVATGHGTYLLWAQSLESIMYLYTAIGLVMYMFNDHIFTQDEIYASAATFTVLDWVFALAYSVCQQIILAVSPAASIQKAREPGLS